MMMVLNDDDGDDCDKAPPLETLLAWRADRRTAAAAAYWFHRSHNGDAMPSGAIWKCAKCKIARNMERNIRCNRER